MANFKMRANICTYCKNADLLVSSARNIDILSGSNSSEYIESIILKRWINFIQKFITFISNIYLYAFVSLILVAKLAYTYKYIILVLLSIG